MEIYQRLQAQHLQPWMDKMDLLPGQQWRQEIPKALRASDFVLIFFSQHSVAKQGYVQRESKLALDTLEEMPEGRIHTIPVRLDDCRIPDQFRDIQWCDLFDEYGFERLMLAIRYGIQQRSAPEADLSIVSEEKSVATNEDHTPLVQRPPEDEYIAQRGHLVHKLKAKDSTGRWAYYFVLVESDREQEFLDRLKDKESIDLEDYGSVIASSYGETPSEEVKTFLKERYGFNV
jgi:TIR domain